MTAPIKADVTAADRLLKAAVKRAAAVIGDDPLSFDAAEEILAIAGTAAGLLLDGAA